MRRYTSRDVFEEPGEMLAELREPQASTRPRLIA